MKRLLKKAANRAVVELNSKVANVRRNRRIKAIQRESEQEYQRAMNKIALSSQMGTQEINDEDEVYFA